MAPNADRAVRHDELVGQLRALGVAPGGVLVVHTAFSKVRPVEGGPVGLIEALRAVLGPESNRSWTVEWIPDGARP